MRRIPLDEEALRDDYAEGQTLWQIAAANKVHPVTVQRRAREYGIPVRRGHPRVEVDTAEIARRYAEGKSTTQLADMYKCSRRVIYNRLAKAGITLRSRGAGLALVWKARRKGLHRPPRRPKSDPSKNRPRVEIDPDELYHLHRIEGRSYAYISRRLNVSHTAIANRAIESGVARSVPPDRFDASIRRLYEAGYGTRSVAKHLRLPRALVSARVREMGIFQGSGEQGRNARGQFEPRKRKRPRGSYSRPSGLGHAEERDWDADEERAEAADRDEERKRIERALRQCCSPVIRARLEAQRAALDSADSA